MCSVSDAFSDLWQRYLLSLSLWWCDLRNGVSIGSISLSGKSTVCTEYSMHSNCEELLVHNQNMPGAGNAVRQVAQLELLVMVACCCQVESVNWKIRHFWLSAFRECKHAFIIHSLKLTFQFLLARVQSNESSRNHVKTLKSKSQQTLRAAFPCHLSCENFNVVIWVAKNTSIPMDRIAGWITAPCWDCHRGCLEANVKTQRRLWWTSRIFGSYWRSFFSWEWDAMKDWFRPRTGLHWHKSGFCLVESKKGFRKAFRPSCCSQSWQQLYGFFGARGFHRKFASHLGMARVRRGNTGQLQRIWIGFRFGIVITTWLIDDFVAWTNRRAPLKTTSLSSLQMARLWSLVSSVEFEFDLP